MSERPAENRDLNDEQRLFLLEHAMMRVQETMLSRFGSAGYLGICVNSGAHPGVDHPHWDWDYFQTMIIPERKDVPTAEYSADEVALWCGVGAHAMSALDPGQQRVTVDQWDEDSQRLRPIRVRACGDHATPVVTNTRPKRQLTAAPVQDGKYLVDAEEYDRYIQSLEKDNGIGQA